MEKVFRSPIVLFSVDAGSYYGLYEAMADKLATFMGPDVKVADVFGAIVDMREVEKYVPGDAGPNYQSFDPPSYRAECVASLDADEVKRYLQANDKTNT